MFTWKGNIFCRREVNSSLVNCKNLLFEKKKNANIGFIFYYEMHLFGIRQKYPPKFLAEKDKNMENLIIT